MTPARPLLALFGALALCRLAGVAAAQTQMDPSSHVLSITKGDTAVVKVKTHCLSQILVETPNPGIVKLGKSSTKPTKSLSVKITAKGKPGKVAQVRFTIQPFDETCGQEELLVVGVFVVGETKKLEHDFKSGTKKTNPDLLGAKRYLKQLRKDLRQIAADHRLVIKMVLGQLKAGAVTVPPVIPPGPADDATSSDGPAPMTQSEKALTALSLSEFAALDRAEDAYWRALKGMNKEAAGLLNLAALSVNAGFTVPASLQPNTRGEWDRRRDMAWKSVTAGVRRLGSLSTQAQRKIEALSVKRGEPIFVRSAGLSLPFPGDGGATPLTGSMADETLNMGLTILSAKAWNGPTLGGFSLGNGRIRLIARSASSDLTASFQRLAFFGQPVGNPQSGSFAVDQTSHQATIVWPTADKAPNLQPGTWDVVLTGPAGDSVSAHVVVPVN